MTNVSKISWSQFSFWGNEKKYVNQALNSTWLSGGVYIEQFETKLEEELSLANALVVANGTAALQLAFLGIDLKPGDEVIVPSFGFLAATNVLTLMHAIPVFVDVDINNWCIDPAKIEEKITTKTKAIVTIHNFGVINEIDKIQEIAKRNNIFLIEDCAESIFSKYNDVFCGNFGDINTFSFHATKTIASGEGGMVSCRNPAILEKLKLIRSHGLRRETKHYWHEFFGNNFRISNLLAAVGLAQLECHQKIQDAKLNVIKQYKKHLSKVKGIRFQDYPKNSSPIIWAVALYIDPKFIKISRDELLLRMTGAGIECRPGFYTPNQLDIYIIPLELTTDFTIADDLAKNIIVLPSFPKISNKQIKYICNTMKSFLNSPSIV